MCVSVALHIIFKSKHFGLTRSSPAGICISICICRQIVYVYMCVYVEKQIVYEKQIVFLWSTYIHVYGLHDDDVYYYIRWRLKLERRWVLLKIPRCDIDGVGEGK